MFKILKTTSVLLLVIAICSSCKTNYTTKKEFNFSELKELANLATVECGFNNIATVSKEGSFLWIDTSRKAFIEYTGVAKLGIDFDELQYDKDSNTILIPKAKVLSVYDDTNSYEYIASDESIFIWLKNEIDSESIRTAITESLDSMKNSLENNKVMLRKAQGLARIQIEDLIENLYTMDGKVPRINYILE